MGYIRETANNHNCSHCDTDLINRNHIKVYDCVGSKIICGVPDYGGEMDLFCDTNCMIKFINNIVNNKDES